MSKSRSIDCLIFLMLVFIYLVLTPPLAVFLNHPDNCSPLAFYENIKATEVIYRDFVVQFPPGIYYLAASIQTLLWNNFLGYVFLICTGNALVSFLIYKMTVELYGLSRGIGAMILSVAFHPVLYKWYLCAFPLLALWLAVLYLKNLSKLRKRRFMIGLVGVSIGLSVYFRIDTAACAAISILIAQAGLLRNRSGSSAQQDDEAPALSSYSVFVDIVICFIGGFMTVFPLLVMLGYCGTFSSAWHSVFGLAARAPGALSLPYPRPIDAIVAVVSVASLGSARNIHVVLFYVIPFVYGVFLAFSLKNVFLTTSPARSWRAMPALPVAVFGALLFMQAMHRSDLAHLLQVATVFWIIVAGLVPRQGAVLKWLVWSVVVASALLVYYDLRNHYTTSLNPAALGRKVREYYVGAGALPDHPVTRVVKYIQAHSKPNHRLLITSHSVQIYYFAHRKFAGGLMYYQPWHEELYAKVADKLESQKHEIDLVVSISKFKFDGLEDRSLRIFASSVYSFIERNYCCDTALANYSVLKPREGTADCKAISSCLF